MRFFSKQSTTDMLDDTTVSRGLWFARNKEKIVRVLHLGLAAIDLLLLVFFLILGWSWFSDRQQTKTLLEKMPTSPLLFENRSTPLPLTAIQAVVVPHDSESIDAMITITNTNAHWAAISVPYEILVNGQVVGERTIALAPGDKHIATALRIPSTSDTPSVDIRMQNVQWKTLSSSAELPAVQWNVSDVSLNTSALIDDAENQLSQLQFSLTNASAYGYVEPEVVVTISRDDDVIAIGSVSLNDIFSFEEKTLQFAWPAFTVRDGLTADVFVNTNRLDPKKRILSSRTAPEEDLLKETDESIE